VNPFHRKKCILEMHYALCIMESIMIKDKAHSASVSERGNYYADKATKFKLL